MKNAHRQRERTIIHLSVVGSVSFFVSKQTGTTKFQKKKNYAIQWVCKVNVEWWLLFCFYSRIVSWNVYMFWDVM